MLTAKPFSGGKGTGPGLELPAEGCILALALALALGFLCRLRWMCAMTCCARDAWPIPAGRLLRVTLTVCGIGEQISEQGRAVSKGMLELREHKNQTQRHRHRDTETQSQQLQQSQHSLQAQSHTPTHTCCCCSSCAASNARRVSSEVCCVNALPAGFSMRCSCARGGGTGRRKEEEGQKKGERGSGSGSGKPGD